MPIISTSIDILYLALSVSAIILTLLLSVALIRIIKLLWNIENISKSVASLLDLANNFIIKPVQIFSIILEYLWVFLNKWEEVISNKKKGGKGKS